MNAAIEQARTLFFQGNEHFEADRLSAAAEAYRLALALMPGRASVLANLGITLWRQGQFSEALPVLQQATAADPSHAEAWLAQGVCAEMLGLWEPVASALQQG